jgi:hypothetical protein
MEMADPIAVRDEQNRPPAQRVTASIVDGFCRRSAAAFNPFA